MLCMCDSPTIFGHMHVAIRVYLLLLLAINDKFQSNIANYNKFIEALSAWAGG